MKNTYLTALAGFAVLSATSAANADVNQVVEGVYSAECQTVTLSAGIFKSSCSSTSSSLLCQADWIGKPFEMTLKCGVGELTTRVERTYQDCLTSDLRVLDATGNELFNPTKDICDALKGVLMEAAVNIESTTNGTFGIDVATNTWISAMTGTFQSINENELRLGYATATFPWSSGFAFGMVSGIPGAVEISDVCGGPAALTLVSGGSVEKATGALTLGYNLNGTASCGTVDGEALTVTVNLHADVAGYKR